MSHVRVALVGVALFGSVFMSSGRIRENNGLGYDGIGYASLVTSGLDNDNTPNGRVRPLVVLVNRAVYRTMRLDILTTFMVTNVVWMLLLGIGLSLLLARYGAPESARLCVVANIALCIATSQMYAYYPVQVDLGALTLMVLAAWCVVAGPAWLAVIATAAAAASREFGVAVALFGCHRELRQGRWLRAAATYLPAILLAVAIRAYVLSTSAAVVEEGHEILSVAGLLGNLKLWADPAFVTFFVYFLITVFGGLSALVLVQGRRLIAWIRQEHELLSLLVPIVAMSAIGSADIWRYLVFTLPAVAILWGMAIRETRGARWSLVAVTMLTVATQRPWREINEDRYFNDWFPYYHWLSGEGVPAGLMGAWAWRIGLLAIGLLVLRATVRADRRSALPAMYHVRL